MVEALYAAAQFHNQEGGRALSHTLFTARAPQIGMTCALYLLFDPRNSNAVKREFGDREGQRPDSKIW
jgi:hypothetical protein